MSGRKRVKHIYEGSYVAEVDVELIEDDSGWSPRERSSGDVIRIISARKATRNERKHYEGPNR